MVKNHVLKWKFDGKREAVIERDGCCVYCGMTREQHYKKYNRDICIHHKDGRGVSVPISK
jgi:hypothetical protein